MIHQRLIETWASTQMLIHYRPMQSYDYNINSINDLRLHDTKSK